jgi:hypothetical protein
VYDTLESSTVTLLVAVDGSMDGALKVRKQRTLVLKFIGAAESRALDGIRHLAGIMATDELTARLVSIPDKDGEEYKSAVHEMRLRMDAIATAYWDATPDFSDAVHQGIAPDMRDHVWRLIPKICSHDIFTEELSEEQVWLVD